MPLAGPRPGRWSGSVRRSLTAVGPALEARRQPAAASRDAAASRNRARAALTGLRAAGFTRDGRVARRRSAGLIRGFDGPSRTLFMNDACWLLGRAGKHLYCNAYLNNDVFITSALK